MTQAIKTEGEVIEVDERVTVNGSDYWLKRKMIPLNVDYPAALKLEVLSPEFITPNYQDAGAGTWKVIQGGIAPPNPSEGNQYVNGFSVEVSKRRRPMPFWHRNMDNDELIICLNGKVTWETELGKAVLTPGTMILIPRGVAHRVVPEESPQYVAIEIKAPTMKMVHVGQDQK
ncbi:MAG: homogentisate 1,2-dioxygenase [Aigarchaeota archaeon]|nr:homogentisate 1,2-dioxygenase [Aigarchaeota archaeon]MDW8092784.1 cupin domain-containing protein [Nitrososphaerota archaeon]